MQPYAKASARAQAGRLRSLALAALKQYELPGDDHALRLIMHHENTTFRLDGAVDSSGEDGSAYYPGRFLVRVHRAGYQTVEAIRSELLWLAALSREAGLLVPDPAIARSGEPLVTASARGVPEPRVVSVLRWLPGAVRGRSPGTKLMHAVGAVTARLHTHSASWRRPAGFFRGRFDYDGLFHHNGTAGDTFEPIWDGLSVEAREVFEAVADATRSSLDRQEAAGNAWGLIHADLHFDNVLFLGDSVRVIDFDDCAVGPWIYDAAVTLGDYVSREDWPALRDAYFEGYATERDFPEALRDELPVFMAARAVTLALWALAQARHNPDFAGFESRLPRRLEVLREWLAGRTRWNAAR